MKKKNYYDNQAWFESSDWVSIANSANGHAPGEADGVQLVECGVRAAFWAAAGPRMREAQSPQLRVVPEALGHAAVPMRPPEKLQWFQSYMYI